MSLNIVSSESLCFQYNSIEVLSDISFHLEAGDYLTTQSFQFTADVAALGPYGRGYRRVKFIFDTSDGTSRIVYRQDLTSLGWALGKDVRQNQLSAKGT